MIVAARATSSVGNETNCSGAVRISSTCFLFWYIGRFVSLQRWRVMELCVLATGQSDHTLHGCVITSVGRQLLQYFPKIACILDTQSPLLYTLVCVVYVHTKGERVVSQYVALSAHTGCTVHTCIRYMPTNLQYKPHQIPKLKCFSSRLAVGFAQSIETRG